MGQIKAMKQIEKGFLPKEWEVVRLEKVCNQRNEIIQPTRKGEFKFIGLEHIESGKIKPKSFELDSNIKSSKFRFYRGDILYGKLRPYLDKAVIADFDGICSTDLIVLNPNENKANLEFLIYILHSNKFINHAISNTAGTNHPRTSWKAIGKFKLPLPPLPEQKKIAEILSTVDKAIEKVDSAIEKTERLKKGLMQELLTGRWNTIDGRQGRREFKQTDIGRIPKEWEVINLGDKELTEIIMGQSPPSTTYNKNGKGIPFLQGKAEFGEIYPSPIVFCSEPIKIAEPNDILISVRAPVGDVNIAPFKCCIGRGLASIRPKNHKIHHLYLFYFLKSQKRKMDGLSSGSTFKAIKKEDIENFLIPLPPLHEQKKIAEILGTVDKRLELLRKRKEKLEKVKKGLMDDLLSGRIRVKVG